MFTITHFTLWSVVFTLHKDSRVQFSLKKSHNNMLFNSCFISIDITARLTLFCKGWSGFVLSNTEWVLPKKITLVNLDVFRDIAKIDHIETKISYILCSICLWGFILYKEKSLNWERNNSVQSAKKISTSKWALNGLGMSIGYNAKLNLLNSVAL